MTSTKKNIRNSLLLSTATLLGAHSYLYASEQKDEVKCTEEGASKGCEIGKPPLDKKGPFVVDNRGLIKDVNPSYSMSNHHELTKWQRDLIPINPEIKSPSPFIVKRQSSIQVTKKITKIGEYSNELCSITDPLSTLPEVTKGVS